MHPFVSQGSPVFLSFPSPGAATAFPPRWCSYCCCTSRGLVSAPSPHPCVCTVPASHRHSHWAYSGMWLGAVGRNRTGLSSVGAVFTFCILLLILKLSKEVPPYSDLTVFVFCAFSLSLQLCLGSARKMQQTGELGYGSREPNTSGPLNGED